MSKEIPKWLQELPRQDRTPSLYMSIFRLLMERGLTAEAGEVLETGVREFPESPDLALTMGTLLLDAGHSSQAVEQFKVVAGQIRRFMYAFEKLARIFKQKGENERAVLAYKVFLAHKAFMSNAFGGAVPGVSSGHDASDAKSEVIEGTETETMADLYLQQGQLLQAESIYLHLSQKFPDNSRYSDKLKEIRSLREQELKKQEKSLDVMVKILEGIQPTTGA